MASTDPVSDASCAALIPLGSHATSAPIDLKRPIFIIGARKDIVRLHLQSSTVSKAHCAVVVNAWGCYVHDLGSRTGTQVNGKPITDADLVDGDVLQVGRFQFKYRVPRKPKAKPALLPPAQVTVSTLTEPLVLAKRVLTIGRRVGSDVQFEDSRVSNLHALVVEQDGRRLVRDLSSRTGTWLDEKPVHQEPLADGAPLRIGGATLTIVDQPETVARAADAPLTLADAPASRAVADSGGLDLESIDLSHLGAPDDTVPAAEDDETDALAALRRGWKTPVHDEPESHEPLPIEESAAEPAVAETPASENSAAEAAVEAEVDKHAPLPDPIPATDLDLSMKPAGLPAEPAAETPAVEEAIPLDREPEPATPPTAATESDSADEELLDVEPLDLETAETSDTEPQAVPAVEPVAESPEPAVAESAAGPTEVEPLDIEALALEELELPAEPVAETLAAEPEAPLAEVPAVEEIERAPSIALSPADEVVPDPARLEEPAADIDDLLPDADAPTAGDEVALPIDKLDLAPEPAVAEPIVETESTVVESAAELASIEVVAVDKNEDEAEIPLDLSFDDLTLAPDPETAYEAPADVEALIRDSGVDEPTPVAEIAVAEPLLPAPEPENALGQNLSDVSDSLSAAHAVPQADLVDLAEDELDEAEADLAHEPVPPAVASAETALIAEPLAGDESLDAPNLDDLGLDDAGLDDSAIAELLAADQPATEALPSLADDKAVAALANESAHEPVPHIAPLAVPAAFVEPEVLPAGPDLVRLDEEAAAEDAEDTALAVDLGLVLDDEGLHDGHELPPISGLAAASGPVDIDLWNATPAAESGDHSSIDLSHLGPKDEPTFSPHAASDAPLALPSAEEITSEDLFDTDEIELIEPDGHAEPIAPPLALAAEAPLAPAKPRDADDEISAPQGGSLADLIPGGPPLLGGSFMAMPPQPIVPPPGEKRRPLRVGFGSGRPNRGGPFAAERTIADAMGGVASDEEIEGMLPGQASIDAFSGAPARPIPPAAPSVASFAPPAVQPPVTPAAESATPAIDDEIDADLSFDEDVDLRDTLVDDLPAAVMPTAELAVPAERFRPRGTIRPMVPGRNDLSDAGDTRVMSVTPADVDMARAKRHKRRVRRVIACLIGMAVLIGGAAWGVYYFTPLRSTVDALISFNHLDQLSPGEVANFQHDQNNALLAEPVRQAAVSSLKIPAGFLGSLSSMQEAVDRDPKIRWPSDQPNTMRLRLRSDDEENDVARLRALANAYVGNFAGARDNINTLTDNQQKADSEYRTRHDKLTELNEQLQAMEQAAAGREALKDLSALNAEVLAAQPALTAVTSRRQELEATVDRLGRPIAAPSAVPANTDPVAADTELAQLTDQLSKLQQPALRPESTAAGADARKKLDESISSFEKDLASAQKLQNSPALTTYVEAANHTFTEYRQLIDIFIRFQENRLTQLTELKSKLSDRMQAKAQDMIAKDTDLKKLKDNLDVLTRQQNAAAASGLDEDAKKLDLELRLMKVKVAEREDQIKGDSGSSETITDLQGVIDGMEKDLRDGRRQFDEKVSSMQTEFMKSAPAVASLPGEQKELAEGIEQKLTAVNDARHAYNEAAEKAQADQAKAEADNAADAAALRMKIAARRQDVLAAAQAKQAENDESTRKQRLAAAQTELATVRQQEQAAQQRLAAATSAVELNEKQRRTFAQTDADYQTKMTERDHAAEAVQTVNARVRQLGSEKARLIVPDDRPPELHSYHDKDRRPLYAAIAAAAIALIVGIPMLLDLLALASEAHPHHSVGSVRHDSGPAEGFEPVIVEDAPRKSLPEPASV